MEKGRNWLLVEEGCSSFPSGTLWLSVATFPWPAAGLGSCQENSFCVALNIPLLFWGKKTPTQTQIAVIIGVGQLAELDLFLCINKCCQVMFFQ